MVNRRHAASTSACVLLASLLLGGLGCGTTADGGQDVPGAWYSADLVLALGDDASAAQAHALAQTPAENLEGDWLYYRESQYGQQWSPTDGFVGIAATLSMVDSSRYKGELYIGNDAWGYTDVDDDGVKDALVMYVFPGNYLRYKSDGRGVTMLNPWAELLSLDPVGGPASKYSHPSGSVLSTWNMTIPYKSGGPYPGGIKSNYTLSSYNELNDGPGEHERRWVFNRNSPTATWTTGNVNDFQAHIRLNWQEGR